MKTSLHNATKPISFSTLHKVLTSFTHVMWAHATSEPTCYHADRLEGSEPNNQACIREHKHALIHAHITAQLTAHKAKRTQTLALSCTHALTHACTHACVRKQGTHPSMLASVHSVTHAPRHTRTHTHTRTHSPSHANKYALMETCHSSTIVWIVSGFMLPTKTCHRLGPRCRD
jgi:hypothetical protein